MEAEAERRRVAASKTTALAMIDIESCDSRRGTCTIGPDHHFLVVVVVAVDFGVGVATVCLVVVAAVVVSAVAILVVVLTYHGGGGCPRRRHQ